MQLKGYRVSTEKTAIESFGNGSECVLIERNGGEKIIRTFTIASEASLYEGGSMDAAQDSLELRDKEWEGLLSADVVYLERVKSLD